MKKISRQLLEHLRTPQYRIVEVTAEVKREALRFVCLGDEITLLGRPMILRNAEPVGNGDTLLISGFYITAPGIVRNWGNPEIIHAHD